MPTSAFPEFAEKMRGAGVSSAAIRAFQHNYEGLLAGQTGLIPESEIQPVRELPTLEALSRELTPDPRLLSQVVLVKLNGGLGTSMGLERAKSLLLVKDGLTFLDLIARHLLFLRKNYGARLRLLLMNSFSTSADTREFLERYPELGDPGELELMQSQAPKVHAETLRPATWPANPRLEWCPPGHGDFYPSLLASGWLERLLREGVRYLFISNSDNLGASLDLNLLTYFAHSGKPFLMEVAHRTPADRKGGHLARRNGTFLLRESAQCPEADVAQFQDIGRHGFFNTNNLWLQLEALQELLRRENGLVPLPLIRNRKTLDPRDKASPPVFQLETAMGAAIQCFPDSGAVIVPRTRFAPVKTTADLLALRSDAYRVTEDWRMVLAEGREQPPAITLDSTHYGRVEQLDEKLADGVPSLKRCRELEVRGAVKFNAEARLAGKVTIVNDARETQSLAPGNYEDLTVTL